jgi:hypothetical protein
MSLLYAVIFVIIQVTLPCAEIRYNQQDRRGLHNDGFLVAARSTVFGKIALNLHGTVHRIGDTAELGKDVVSG